MGRMGSRSVDPLRSLPHLKWTNVSGNHHDFAHHPLPAPFSIRDPSTHSRQVPDLALEVDGCRLSPPGNLRWDPVLAQQQFATLAAENGSPPFRLAELPRTLGDWRSEEATDGPRPQGAARITGSTDYIVRTYLNERVAIRCRPWSSTGWRNWSSATSLMSVIRPPAISWSRDLWIAS